MNHDSILKKLEATRKTQYWFSQYTSRGIEKFNALFITDVTDAPFRYRVQHAVEQLCDAGCVAEIMPPTDPKLLQRIPSYNLIILFRLQYSETVGLILDAVRHYGIPAVFDCDDLIFFAGAEQGLHFINDIPQKERDAYKSMTQRLEITARACDWFLGSTSAIANHAAGMGMPSAMHRNLLSRFQERQGARLAHLRRLKPPETLIGYFSGSNTHDRDFANLSEALIKVLQRVPKSRVLVVGHLNCPDFVRRFPDRVRAAPYMPWQEYPCMMARCRVVLAPTANLSLFAHSKSALKFFEAGILGVPVVASPIDEIRHAIVDDKNGWLATTSDEWYERIMTGLNPERSLKAGVLAREVVCAKHTTTSQKGVLAKLLSCIANPQPPSSIGMLPGNPMPPKTFGQVTASLLREARMLFSSVDSWSSPAVAGYSEVKAVPANLPSNSPVSDSVATRFLHGNGIELGALNWPLVVPKAAIVDYVDTLPNREIANRYHDLKTEKLVELTFYDDGQELTNIESSSLDFCVACDVLHRMRNPLGALQNWLRVLRPGGTLYFTVPDHNSSNDGGCKLSTFAQLMLKHYDRTRLEPLFTGAIRRQTPLHFFDRQLLVALIREACRIEPAEQLVLSVDENDGLERLSAVLRKLPPRNVLRRPVTIMVPIYNAFDHVVRTCESVLRHAQGDWYLLTVDDASPDNRISRYLRELARRDKRVKVLTNAINSGFVVTANRGMTEAAKDNDILLLNSDVQVTQGFLRRIQDAAFHTTDTGIVTPFSNNATICSIPKASQDNELPPGFDVDEFNWLVTESGQQKHLEIVTAVGFCMYIRREVLDKIPCLDEKAYGRGFGEENDYCEQAKKHNFRIRICDSQFIFHAGKSSFGAEGHELSKKNGAILEARHPGYHASLQDYSRRDPLGCDRAAINAHLRRWRFRHTPALGIVLHADPFSDNPGGTEIHVLDRVANLAFRRVVLFYPESFKTLACAEVLNGNIADPIYFRAQLQTPLVPYLPHHREAEDLLVWFCRILNVSVMSIDHLLRWPIGAGLAIRKAGLPYFFVSHDFYCICPSMNLLNYNTLKPCPVHSGHSGNELAPVDCLTEHFKLYSPDHPQHDCAGLLVRHQNLFREILRGAERVICPSEDTARTLQSCGMIEPAHITVIPHGLSQMIELPARAQPGALLRVALIGAVSSPLKGAGLILEILAQAVDLPVEWHIFGNADKDNFRSELEALKVPLVIHGRYQRQEIVQRLVTTGIDVALFTSVCAETFSFTLSEAWCAHVPAIVPKLGALAERVKQTGYGWIIAPHSATAAINLLKKLAQRREIVADMQHQLAGFRHITPAQNASVYRALFEPYLNRPSLWPTPPLHHLSSYAGSPPETDGKVREKFLAAGGPATSMLANDGCLKLVPLNHLSIQLEPVLILHATGNDPHLLLPPLSPPADKYSILRIDITSPANTMLQIFYSTAGKSGFAEENSITKFLRHGRNEEIYIELLKADLSAPLRFDPGVALGDYILHDIEYKHLPHE